MRTLAQIFILYITCSAPFAKTLIIGTMPFNPPFETVSQNQHFIGLDIEIMQNVCQLLKTRCEFKALNFADIFVQIESGQIDLGIGSIIINQTRSSKYLLSSSYLASSAQFFVRQDSPIKPLDQLNQKTIGTVTDNVFIRYLENTYQNDTIQIYDKMESALLDLSSKKLDVFFLDKLAVNYWILNSAGEFRALGDAVSIGDGYGIIARKDQTDLIQQVNQALQQMRLTGTDTNIIKNYM